jgi:hypothetical protein
METTITAIHQFILAGKSFFTLQNKETDNRFTYKVCQATDNDNNPKDLWFVSILVGADNENSYQYAGIITPQGFRLTAKSRVTESATSVKAFSWLWGMIKSETTLPEKVEFYHAGRCGRCGRKLTTPESIENGYGPVCLGKLGM